MSYRQCSDVAAYYVKSIVVYMLCVVQDELLTMQWYGSILCQVHSVVYAVCSAG
jgi:hypothetical protein